VDFGVRSTAVLIIAFHLAAGLAIPAEQADAKARKWAQDVQTEQHAQHTENA